MLENHFKHYLLSKWKGFLIVYWKGMVYMAAFPPNLNLLQILPELLLSKYVKHKLCGK